MSPNFELFFLLYLGSFETEGLTLIKNLIHWFKSITRTWASPGANWRSRLRATEAPPFWIFSTINKNFKYFVWSILSCNLFWFDKWRVDIQKGVTHDFSKIVFLATKILEVNANTIAQTIFFFPIGNIFIFDLEIKNLYLEVYWRSEGRIPTLALMGNPGFFFWASGCFIIFVQIVVSSVVTE